MVRRCPACGARLLTIRAGRLVPLPDYAAGRREGPASDPTPDDALTARLRKAVSDATLDLDAHLRAVASVVRRTEKGNTVATRPPEKGRDRRSPPTP